MAASTSERFDAGMVGTDDAAARRVHDDHTIAAAEARQGDPRQRARVATATIEDDGHVLPPARGSTLRRSKDVDADEHLAAP